MASPGLTFAASRRIVHNSFRYTINEEKRSRELDAGGAIWPFGLIVISVLPISIALDTSSPNGIFSIYTSLGAAICIQICSLIIMLNRRGKSASQSELINDLELICASYETSLADNNSEHEDGPSAKLQTIHAGHPHVSVISCYRNKQWQRIPSLLLAEGDVIALQGGDIAPGKCFELISDDTYIGCLSAAHSHGGGASASRKRAVFPNQPSVNEQKSRGRDLVGKVFEKGEKILLRERTATSGSVDANCAQMPAASQLPLGLSYQKHKSLSPNGVELLQLSGDIRCFVMAETPIRAFVKEAIAARRQRECVIAGGPAMSPRLFIMRPPLSTISTLLFGVFDDDSLSKKKSFIRTLFLEVMRRGVIAAAIILSLLAPCLGIRLLLIEDTSVHWKISIVSPVISSLLCFLPMALPIYLLLAESLLTAHLLATTEAVLYEETEGKQNECNGHSKMKVDRGIDATGTSVMRSGGQRPARSSVASSDVDSTDLRNVDDDFSDADEFLDEDIDERAEEIAEASSSRVPWRRHMQYVWAVLARRFFDVNVAMVSGDGGDGSQLLPVPNEDLRVLEALGAVTMVCFVDDDVICEKFSVTEELFLLQAGQEQVGRSEASHNDSVNPSPSSKSSIPFSSTSVKGADRGEQTTASRGSGVLSRLGQLEGGGKGIVLDLFCNAEARGTRFEDPHWWKYLSNLKPIALSALLTYEPMPPLAQSPVLANGNGSYDFLEASGKGRGPRVEDEGSGGFFPGSKRARTASREQNLALVSHVRRSIPLETLRELAEEIGFVNSDAKYFQRLLEMNVVAPGLCDAKLLEDTHAWGQEESRRRGTLMTQIRSTINLDSRTGGLQMLTQGYPSLLLHYCRDYWDGTSITPFTSADRNEVLSVYDRWALEDFDVVAFAYTPVPVYLKPALVEAHRVSQNQAVHGGQGGMEVEGKATKVSSGRTASKSLNCVFIVDPFTEDQDRVHRQKKKGRNGHRIQQNNIAHSVDVRGLDTLEGSKDPVDATKADAVVGAHTGGAERVLPSAARALKPPESALTRKREANEIGQISRTELQNCGDMSIPRFAFASEDVTIDVSLKASRSVTFGAEDMCRTMQRSTSDSALLTMINLDISFVPESSETGREGIDREGLGEPQGSQRHLTSVYDEMDAIDADIGAAYGDDGNEDMMVIDEADVMNVHESVYTGGDSGADADTDEVFVHSDISHQGSPIPKSDTIAVVVDGDAHKEHQVAEDRPEDAGTTADLRSPVPRAMERGSSKMGNKRNKVTSDEPTDIRSRKGRSYMSASSLAYARRNSAGTSATSARLSAKKSRSLGALLWPTMRHQVFLGMAASSVPVKPDAPEVREELERAGVRFVYFSPRNMRRSKPVAEKIGIPFDWNCAISLRDLEGEDQQDPHRAISTYGDWDVHARLPHGVEAIKRHLREVDNVPLLVSLYTDATPRTIKAMVGVFRDYHEVVLAIGSAYRDQNAEIFGVADVAIAVAMLPGDHDDVDSPVRVASVLRRFPDKCTTSLAKSDLLLHFRLVSLGCLPLLQNPASESFLSAYQLDRKLQADKQTLGPQSKKPASTESSSVMSSDGRDSSAYAVEGFKDFLGEALGKAPPQIRLSVLIEGIRMGRVYLANATQALAALCVCNLSLALWSLAANMLPMSIPPSAPPSTTLLFTCVYFPLILLSILFSAAPKGIMKNVPRKNFLKDKDAIRFTSYLVIRSFYVVFSVILVGVVSFLTLFRGPSESWYSSCWHFYNVSSHGNDYLMKLRSVQDIMSVELLIGCTAQLFTMLDRTNTSLFALPTPLSHPWFWLACIFSLSAHFCFLFIEARGSSHCLLRCRTSVGESDLSPFNSVDWVLWLLVATLPLLGVVVGLLLNNHDAPFNKRYLQFLRLEFETRLGMHSPR